MSAEERTAFFEQFQTLNNSITTYLNDIITLEPIRPMRALLVISTLTRGALIRLHDKFIGVDSRSKDACVNAANGILTLLQQVRVSEYLYIDPIMAVSRPLHPYCSCSPTHAVQVLLGSAGQVYLVEVARFKSSVKTPPTNEDRAYVASLISSAQQLATVMTEFGSICPLLGSWYAPHV